MARVPPSLEPVLSRYRELLAERFGPRLLSVRLFGSRARGDAEPDSDVDLAVVIRGLTEAERTEAMDRAFEAWRAVGRDGPLLAALVWSEDEHAQRLARERRIALDIEREGIPV